MDFGLDVPIGVEVMAVYVGEAYSCTTATEFGGIALSIELVVTADGSSTRRSRSSTGSRIR
jgi:hypothetical protein